jgi:hypothetical protein
MDHHNFTEIFVLMALHQETLPEQLLECLIIIIIGPSDVGFTMGEQQVGSCSTTRGTSPALHSSASKSSRLGNQRDKGLLVQIRARNVPPKQGRGSNAKKAAAQGVQRRMRGQDSDLDAGWTQVSLNFFSFFPSCTLKFLYVSTRAIIAYA